MNHKKAFAVGVKKTLELANLEFHAKLHGLDKADREEILPNAVRDGAGEIRIRR